MALENLGKYDEAIASYDKALQINPDDPSPLYNKARAYALQDEIELTIENLRQAIQLSPEEYQNLARTDPDFTRIRSDPRFQSLIGG
jgi:tetratricopeptide (TPR) repeat protein